MSKINQFSADLALKIELLPTTPGVYQYFDKQEKLLYIGKAKNLKKRVQSYFYKEHDNAKTNVLVKKITDLKFIVVNTEFDALLLENNLIKKYQPRYNILLKDDKTYPWICIKKEPFPRVFLTRKLIRDGSEYFGPYANVKVSRVLISLIKELFQVRTCQHNLSPNNIAIGKYKVCLEYHIKNCKGGCEGLQIPEDYLKEIKQIRAILKGDFKSVLKILNKKMITYAKELQFEEAQGVKVKIDALENYQSKSTVVHQSINNVDVFSIISDETHAYINYLKIGNGAIIQSHTSDIKKKLNESDEIILAHAILVIRERFQSISDTVYLPFKIDLNHPEITFIVPKIGDKRKIVELSIRNSKYYKMDQLKQVKIVDPERHTNRIMVQMKKDLRLSKEPRHIECFDNSNIQGTNPVAACVVFKNGKPSKKEYRHFNIKTVEGPDDYASMEEVVYRRYSRLLKENKPLPDLILIDGGKGQLSSALKSLDALELRGKIAILGIAKRLEELFFPGDSLPLYLDKKSETLKILQFARNEAHRFGIEHHRNRRSKSSLESELEHINGIGAKTITALIHQFKSVKRIKESNFEQLAQVVGKKKAIILLNYFKSESGS